MHAPEADLVLTVAEGVGEPFAGSDLHPLHAGDVAVIPAGERRGIRAHTARLVLALRQRLEHVLTFLRTGVLAHAEVEEATVYPAAERLLRAIGGATDTMTIEHEQICARVDELERIAAEEPDSEALRSRIARSLAALEALLRAHFDKEEEVYLPLLAHLAPAQASALANALEMAAPGGHHH